MGLEFVSEQVGRHVFMKTQKNMLLLFNPEVTRMEKETIHGAITPPSMIHVALEIEDTEYENAKQLLSKKNIQLKRW